MKTVWLDAGHGGKDCGAVNSNLNVYEKDLTLKLALETERQLKEQGINVVMTRRTDTTTDYIQRSKLENNNNCDLAISLHLNSCAKPNTARGCEIWVHSRANNSIKQWADNTLAEILKVSGTKNRGVKQGYPNLPNCDFWCNRLTKSMSMLIEIGFVNSDEDTRQIMSHCVEYAKAVTMAVCKQFKVKYKQPTTDKPITPHKITAYDVTVTNVGKSGLNILVGMLEAKQYRYVVKKRTGSVVAFDVEVTNVGQLGLDILVKFLKIKGYRFRYKSLT